MLTRFVQFAAPILLAILSTPFSVGEIQLEGPPRRIKGNPITLVRKFEKKGRNEPCSCGSSKKAKSCCGR